MSGCYSPFSDPFAACAASLASAVPSGEAGSASASCCSASAPRSPILGERPPRADGFARADSHHHPDRGTFRREAAELGTHHRRELPQLGGDRAAIGPQVQRVAGHVTRPRSPARADPALRGGRHDRARRVAAPRLSGDAGRHRRQGNRGLFASVILCRRPRGARASNRPVKHDVVVWPASITGTTSSRAVRTRQRVEVAARSCRRRVIGGREQSRRACGPQTPQARRTGIRTRG